MNWRNKSFILVAVPVVIFYCAVSFAQQIQDRNLMARRARQEVSRVYVPGMFKTVDDLVERLKPGDRIIVRGDVDVIRDGQLVDESGRIPALIFFLTELYKKLEAKGIQGDEVVVMICGHNGRPKGKDVVAEHREFSLEALTPILTTGLRQSGALNADEEVKFVNGFMGDQISRQIDEIARMRGNKKIILLQNFRFNAGENAKDAAKRLVFAQSVLATLKANHYVNEAFASSAGTNASTMELPDLIQQADGLAVGGIQLFKEVDNLTEVLIGIRGAKIAIFGGAKLDKFGTLIDWLDKGVLVKGDTLHVGGLLGLYVLYIRGQKYGELQIDSEVLKDVEKIEKLAAEKGVNLVTYLDAVIQNVNNPDDIRKVPIDEIPAGFRVVDIGDNTKLALESIIRDAKVRFYNGAQGIYDDRKHPEFGDGTRDILQIIERYTGSGEINIGMGGDGVTTIRMYLSNPEAVFQLISTGGGAGMDFIANRWLIAFDYLSRRD